MSSTDNSGDNSGCAKSSTGTGSTASAATLQPTSAATTVLSSASLLGCNPNLDVLGESPTSSSTTSNVPPSRRNPAASATAATDAESPHDRHRYVVDILSAAIAIADDVTRNVLNGEYESNSAELANSAEPATTTEDAGTMPPSSQQ